MRKNLRVFSVVCTSIVVAACSSSSGNKAAPDGGGGGTDAGSDTGGGSAFTVSPATADVLTCSTQAFAVSPSQPVTWSVSPASGSIDTTGLYTAPKTTPSRRPARRPW